MFWRFGSKKSVLDKYALNGTCSIDPVQQEHHSIGIGTCANIHGFFIRLVQLPYYDDKLFLFPIIDNHQIPTMRVQYYLNVLKANGSSGFTTVGEGELSDEARVAGESMDAGVVLSEQYRVNGFLKIEYGLHVESILDEDRIWNFNFHDPLFDGNHCIVNASIGGDIQQFYAHKQILDFHFSSKKVTFGSNYVADEILQIAHGVRKQVDSVIRPYSTPLIESVLIGATHPEIRNVARLAEFQFIHKNLKYSDHGLSFSILWSRPHILAHFLRFGKQKKKKEMILNHIKSRNIEKMTGEIMKMLTRFFLEF